MSDAAMGLTQVSTSFAHKLSKMILKVFNPSFKYNLPPESLPSYILWSEAR